LPQRFPEGCVGEPSPARPRAGEALLSQRPCRVQPLDNDHAVGLGEPGGEVVDRVAPDRRQLSVKAVGEMLAEFARLRNKKCRYVCYIDVCYVNAHK
jgi:hypothetical protein